jgi:23S rRNA pseudouridine1911/1915/1917 synthase
MPDETPSLLDLLQKQFPQSTRTTLRAMIAGGRVYVDGVVARTAKHPVVASSAVRVMERVAARTALAPELPFEILYEDTDVIAIDKPWGVITSSGAKDKRPTAIAMLRAHFASIDPRIEVGLVHRLDADASGVIIFSKNDPAFHALKDQFKDKSAGRIYNAIVIGTPRPPSGTLESRLHELPDGRVVTVRNPHRGEHAVTHYKTLESQRGVSLVEVSLETGRKHQIRVHLSELGTPIVGDPLYSGDIDPRIAPRLMLVAKRLDLEHPRTGKRIQIEVRSLPAEMIEWWDNA